MDRFAYIAMTGAKHALEAQQVTSHNLANANTPGFRADLDGLLSRPVYGPGLPTRVYSEESGIGSDMSQGTMRSTGRDLDLAIQGDGWFTVQAEDGTEAYTRRGDFRIGSGGVLETGDGRLVLGNAGPVAIPPAESLVIGADGTVSVVPDGQPENAQAVVDRIRLVNPPTGQLRKGEDGLFRLADGAAAPLDASVKVRSGMLESSNVNSVDALVQMIGNARSFETYVKLLQTARENDERSQQLLQAGG